FVLGARSADLLLVVVHGEPQSGQRQCRVVALSPHVPGLSMRHHAMLDLTRPMSNLRFEGVLVEPADLLGVAVSGAITPGANAEPALERALDEAVIALSAEAVGGAEFTLEAATGFVKERVQFGRTIGSFQAIKHRLADMMVLLEAAKSVCWYAACAADELPPGELALAASAAKSCCADAFYDTAANAIQLHGGIGFTWDHHAHVYFRRARAAATLLGSPTWHRERVASLIGLDAGTAAPRG
ncbi:MAG: acyl-CoA dehydrogenase, partial [Proteobacteria bacterium]|nr:acyl-CoA dehydrogenase [Pseudomonadota bacterium]